MSNIEWTQQTWNPIAGCSKVSAGCANCYAEVMAGRLERMGMTKYQGLTVLQGKHPRWTGKIAFDERVLHKPLQTRKPTTYFVNSMSDLFHENVMEEQIDRVFAVMALCPQHTFQVLTKRPERMLAYLANPGTQARVAHACVENGSPMSDGFFSTDDPIDHSLHEVYWKNCRLYYAEDDEEVGSDKAYGFVAADFAWPRPNVWLGVSVENQETANERIPLLLDTPAAVRFISAEPLLERVSLERVKAQAGEDWFFDSLCVQDIYWSRHGEISDGPEHAQLDWVIVGGESGYGSRECNIEWIRSIVKQCLDAEVPVFVKQLGMKPYVGKPGNRLKQLDRKKGGWMDSWPEDLRVRQMPEVCR